MRKFKKSKETRILKANTVIENSFIMSDKIYQKEKTCNFINSVLVYASLIKGVEINV